MFVEIAKSADRNSVEWDLNIVDKAQICLKHFELAAFLVEIHIKYFVNWK